MATQSKFLGSVIGNVQPYIISGKNHLGQQLHYVQSVAAVYRMAYDVCLGTTNSSFLLINVVTGARYIVTWDYRYSKARFIRIKKGN